MRSPILIDLIQNPTIEIPEFYKNVNWVGSTLNAEILKEELAEPEIKDYAETILASSRRLSDTLNSILDLSKIASFNENIKYEKFDLKKLITDAVKLFNIKAIMKGLKLSYINDYDTFIITTDKVILRKIINNLISNSVKYTLKG